MDVDYHVSPNEPAQGSFPITPADSALTKPTRGLYVGTTGNLEVTLCHDYANNAILPAAVNLAASTITIFQHAFLAGDRVMVGSTAGSNGVPAGLAVQTAYYVLVVDGNTIQLSATKGGAAITLTGQGAGVLSLFKSTLFNAAAVGYHPLACRQVNAATTASNIVGLR